MLIRICSDLHCEFWNTSNPNKINRILYSIIPSMTNDKETVLVIAGDIGLYHLSNTWVYPLNLLSLRFKKVIWVSGNHMYYNNNSFGHEYKFSIVGENITLLENSYILIDETFFIGANLWTNMNNSNPIDMLACSRGMRDFEVIKKVDGSTLTPKDTVEVFNNSAKFIFKKMLSGYDCVVVTHHLPSSKSIAEEYKNSNINAAYYTELYDHIYDSNCALWIHGHTHSSMDYLINNTRVICNPYGYKDVEVNKNYNPKLILEV